MNRSLPAVMKYRADGDTETYNNINFARSRAERIAKKEQRNVKIFTVEFGRNVFEVDEVKSS